MSRWEVWSLHALTLVVSITGAVYFWMKYLLETGDPLSVINHPLQPAMLNVHILAAPCLVFVLGAIANSHIALKWRTRSRLNRTSGRVALFSFPPMVLSGYLLQVVTQETAARVVLVLHLATGALFAITYLIHQLVMFRLWSKRLRRRSVHRLAP